MFRKVFVVFGLVSVGVVGCNKEEVPAPLPVFAEPEKKESPPIIVTEKPVIHYADEPQPLKDGPNGVPQAPSMVPEAK